MKEKMKRKVRLLYILLHLFDIYFYLGTCFSFGPLVRKRHEIALQKTWFLGVAIRRIYAPLGVIFVIERLKNRVILQDSWAKKGLQLLNPPPSWQFDQNHYC